MKITVIRHSIRNRGGDRLVLDYCRYLVSRGHEIIYWTNEIDTRFRIDPGIRTKRIPWPGVAGTIGFALSTRFNSDIVLVDTAVMFMFVFIMNGKKVISLEQDDDRLNYPPGPLRWMMQLIYFIAFTIFRIRVIAVSDDLANKLEKIAKGRVKSVPNGIDHRIFYREERSPCLAEKKFPVAVVLYSRRDFRKGLDVGIRAVEELASLRGVKDWELWIIGSDPVEIKADGLRIKRWGFLEENDLRAVLSAADIYLLPSRSEGLSLLLLSALACRCIVVGTKACNIITNEVNGLVSPVEDWKALAWNINRVMNDKDLFSELRRNGYALSQDYDLRKSCERFESALVEFANKNGKTVL